jgi:NhaA family Na+:H+ antiporter
MGKRHIRNHSTGKTSGANLELPPELSKTPVRRLIKPLAAFLKIESVSGILLVICTVTALVIANSSSSHAWISFWHTEVRISIGSWELTSSLTHLINDGLMTIFFFVVGLEIKREIVDGELRSAKKAALPIIAALGGMLVPAAIFLLLQYGRDGVRGWGIPMATDIAFAVGIMTLLGRNVPAGLKIFLLALAIVDDIGAIVIIAFFYSGSIHTIALALAILGLSLVVGMNKLGVRSIAAYSIVGLGIWGAMFHSGIHPTIAGVVLGVITPGHAPISRHSLVTLLLDVIDRLDGTIDRRQVVGKLTEATRETVSPLERLEAALHPWVAFAIMPLFALANAGVVLQPEAASHEVARAVVGGLVVGKPVGIFLFSWLAVNLNLAELPQGVSWRSLLGAGCLGGIGFTMSLFIAGLALHGTLLDAGKIGTLVGSTISAVVGYFILLVSLRAKYPDSGR